MILLCLPPILPRDKSDRLGNSIAKCGASVRVCVCVRDQCTVILTAMHKNTIAHHELKVCSIHKNYHQKLIAVTEAIEGKPYSVIQPRGENHHGETWPS